MSKIGFLTKIFRPCGTKNSVVKDSKTVIAEYLSKHPEARDVQPFCQKVWSETNLSRFRRCKITGNVTHHGYLNGINHHLTSGFNPKGLSEVFSPTGITSKEMIEITDQEFKVLPKLKDDLCVFRCVGEKPDFLSEYKRYSKSLKVQKGDVVTMPEYAYATSDIDYAKVYLPNNKGILYNISVPKGSRISQTGSGVNNEVVFPRCSQFECMGTEQHGDTLIVKLKYIKPVDVTA